jgi:hypothetical protein
VTVIDLISAAEILPPTEDEEFLAQAEGQIRGYGKLVFSGIVAIGQKLVEVKDRVGYQGFVRFVTKRLQWSERSGNNFVAVYEMLLTAKFAVEDLTIDASSLYLIAAPSTPAEVREGVLEKAASPEGVSRAEVERLVEAAKAEAAAVARADLDGKLIYSEDELAAQFIKITGKYEKQIKRLETAQGRIARERDRALANVKTLQTKAKPQEAAPEPPTFDSNASFRAMCIAQAVAALNAELRITPRQLVDIEREMATTIHRQPELAMAKLAELKGNARIAADWLGDLLIALEGESSC